MGKAQRDKGLSYERYLAKRIKHVFPKVKRHLEFQKEEARGYDLDNTGNLYIQAKRGKLYAPITKIEEVKVTGENVIPVLITKGDRKEDMVVLSLTNFIKIIEDIGTVYEGSSCIRLHQDMYNISTNDNASKDLKEKIEYEFYKMIDEIWRKYEN